MKYRLLFLLLTLNAYAYSQESFVKGYIVRNSGDTIRGFIKRDMDISLAKGVYFKSEMYQKQSQFQTAKEISAFAFEKGNIYHSLTYSDPLDNGSQKTEFAKFLVDGKVSLYAVPRRTTYFFYIKSASDTGHLIYGDAYGARGRVIEPGNFRNVLNMEAQNCEKLKPRVGNIRFYQTDIIQFVSDLNQCAGDDQSQVHYKRTRNEVRFLLYGGGMSLNHNSTYTFQGQVRLISPGVSKRTSIVTGFHYAHVVSFEYSQIEAADANFTTDVFSIPFLFQYNFTETKIQPLIYGGFSFAYRKEKNPDLTDPNVAESNFGFALVGGVGIEYYPIKHLAIKADWRYEFTAFTPTIGIAYRIN